MESIGAFDAKTRLSELLERVRKGESFVITRHGHPIARLVPESGADNEVVANAVNQLKNFHRGRPKVTLQELLDSRHGGHRY
ncbi:MAG TPA: type II toxin-antitoxin system prevent-host-death family antitoxin [Candidatus Eisenbacteria bacterium]